MVASAMGARKQRSELISVAARIDGRPVAVAEHDLDVLQPLPAELRRLVDAQAVAAVERTPAELRLIDTRLMKQPFVRAREREREEALHRDRLAAANPADAEVEGPCL